MNEVKTKVRINKYDNLKGLAIFMIVLGHMAFLRKYDSISFIHDFVFLFDLPLFFFVAGYFSKIGPDEPVKAFKRLFVPFVIFRVLFELFSIFYLGKPPSNQMFIRPGYMLWFLICLFIMKMLLPIFDKFRYPLVTAFILALLIGFIKCNILGISRVFTFMPIFLIGFYFKDYQSKLETNYKRLNGLLNKKSTIILIAIIALLISIIVAYELPFRHIIMKHPYHDFLIDIIYRIIVLGISTLNVLVLNKIMTNSSNIFTKFGRASLTVYLLHGYIIILSKLYLKPVFANYPRRFIAFIFIFSFIITFILSRDIFTNILNKLFDGANNLILKNN